jgi:hypothetical protein
MEAFNFQAITEKMEQIVQLRDKVKINHFRILGSQKKRLTENVGGKAQKAPVVMERKFYFYF